MKKRLILPVLAVLLLAPWPVAYAYDNARAEPGSVHIEAAPAPAAPSWRAYGGAIGGVTRPGDLFYIDTTDSTADVLATLYLTNTDELVRYYRYLTLKVGVYSRTGTSWVKAARSNGELFLDTYITMQNGRVSFTLPGYAKYKVTIDSGCFYLFVTRGGESSLSPTFYLTVE